MSEAPKRTWMDPDIWFPECEKQYGCDVGYVREDLYKELEAKLAKAVELAIAAVNAVDEIQSYEQPDDPWEENALTRGELDAFDFNIIDARTTLAELKGNKE